MKVKLAIPALAMLVLLPAAFLKAQAPPAADAGNKVGTLNVRQAIVSTAEGKQASAELQSQFAPRQTEVENLGKQIEDVQARARQTNISDDERARLARQYDVFSRQFQRRREDLNEDINAAQNEVIERIGQKMIEVLNKYARENGFVLILDVSANTTPVLFAAPTIDVTQDIIRLFDQAHPVRATTPAPAQPRPAQPGQTRPPQQQQPPVKPPQQ